MTVLITIPLAWTVLDQSSAIRFSAVLLGVSLFAFISMREINVLHGLLREQAVTDKLTGLFNRVLLENSLHQAIAQNQRSGVPMSIITFDIDHFKAINDTLGHDRGDTVLKVLGDMLKSRTRASDMAFRIGGDEFLVLYHSTNKPQAIELAEKLRKEMALPTLLPDRQVTISVGVSSLQKGMDAPSWVKTCDKRLYQAKEGGRDRVVA